MEEKISNLQRLKNELARRKNNLIQKDTTLPQRSEAETEKNKGGFVGGVGYTAEKLGLGVLRSLEGISDFVVGGIADLFGGDEFAENLMKNDWVNYSHADEWYDPGKGWQFVGDVAGGVGNMLPSIIITAATAGAAAPVALAGSIASTGQFIGSAMGQSVSEATKETGSLGGKEWLYGTASGALEGGIEAISGGIGGTQVGKVLGKQLGKSTLGKIGMTVAGEGLEEVASDIANPLLKRATGVDENAKVDWKELPRTFAVGGVTGAVMGGGKRVLDAAKVGGFNNLNAAETTQELTDRQADNNIRQLKGKTATYTQEDIARTKENLSKRLQKMDVATRAQFLQANANIANQFNEDGTVKSVAPAPDTYNTNAYSASLQGREGTFAYKPISESSKTTVQAKQVMDTLTKITDGKTNIVLTEDALATESGGTANGLYKDGIIYLNANATDYQKALTVGVHEVIHGLEGTKEYEQLAKAITEEIKNDPDLAQQYNIDKYRAAYDSILEGEWTETTKDYQAVTEIFADFLGNKVANNEQLLRNLSVRNSNVVVRFLNWVRNSIAKLGESAEERAIRKDLQTLERMLVNALEAGTGGISLERVEELSKSAEKRLKTQDGNVQSVKFSENKNADGKIATARASINEKFAEKIDKWDGSTVGFSFVVGRTSKALQSIGIEDKQIRLDATKLKKILGDHSMMSKDVIKNIPNAIENPILIMDSKQMKSRLVLLGEVYDLHGDVVTVILELNPTRRNVKGDSAYLDIIKIASAQGRGNIQSLINGSNIRYIDKNKNRVNEWLNVNRLQLPLRSTNTDSTPIISQENDLSSENAKKVEKNSTSRKSIELIDKYPRLNLNQDVSNMDGVPAIRLTDGSVLPFTENHIEFIKNNNIDVADVESGGWIGEGVYEPTGRSDTLRYKEQQLAKRRMDEKRKKIGRASLPVNIEADVKKHYGSTYRWNETGYILQDGTRLDLSGRNEGARGGYRTVDHRDIFDIVEGSDVDGADAMIEFIARGNIRVMPETPGINLSVEPNAEQYRLIQDFVERVGWNEGYFSVDIDNKNGDTIETLTYEGKPSGRKVVADLKQYFKTGEKPYQSKLSAFRYSIDVNSVADIENKYDDYAKTLFLTEDKNEIHIRNMVLKEDFRGKGIGQAILEDVINYADKVSKTVTLTPTDEYGTRERLKEWYKKNGFVENKGRNADLRISDTMYRLPEKKSTSRASIDIDAALADFPSIDKWFESLTAEELRELIDNDYSVKDISEELNVEPQKLRYLIKREGLGNSYVEDSKKAVMKQTRIDEAIEDSGASNPTYARDYITAISPKNFIDLTVTKNHVERDAFDAEVIGDHGSKMGEYDYEKALQTSRSPYLQIDKATGRVIGHNGRHRIRALEKAGIQSVEIQVEFFDEDGRLIKYNAETIPKMAISSQFDTDIETTISKIIPLNEAHRAEIENTYGERANTNAGVRYSLNVAETYTPKQAAKAIDDVVDMLVEIGGVDVDQYDVQVYGKDALAKRIAEQLNAKATTSTKTAAQRAEGFIDEILDKVRIAKTDVAALIDAEQTLNFLRKYYHSMDLRSVKSDINNERHYNLFSGGEKAMAWDSVLQEIVELHPDFEMDTDIETLLNVMDAYENARNTIRENKVPLSKIVLDLGFAKQMMKEQLKNSLEGNATTYKKVKKQSFAKELEVKKGSGTIDAELDKKTTERVQTVVSDEKLTLKERWENTVEKLKEGRLDQWMKAQIAWTDEQAGILGAGKNVGVVLHGDVQRARSAKAAAMNMLNNEQRDFSGKKRVGDSLKSIFQPIQSRGKQVAQDFNLYLLHQLNVDRMSNVETADRRIKALFKANPMLEDAVNGQYEDAEQWRRAVQKESGGKEYLELLDVENKPVFEEKVDKAFSLEKIQQLEKQYPEFKEAAKKVWNYNKNLLQYRVDAGLITQAQADQMSDMYPHYVPAFYEKNGGSGTSGASVGNKGIAVRTGIKKAKGSTGVSDIKDVSTSIAKQTVAVVRAASINNVVSKLYDGAVAKNDFTDIEEVGREKVANPDVDYDKEIPKVNQVYFYKDGERITLDVTDYVYAGFQGLTAQAQLSDPLTSASAKLISLFKKAVTSWNPLFAATNAIRDVQEALFYTKYGAFKLMGNYGKSLFMRKHDPKLKELWQQYVAMGGTGSGYFSNDTGVYDARNKVKKGLAAAMEKFTWLNEWIEQTPRFAEFVASVEAGNSVEQALYDSAEVTTNFSRGGTVAKKLNRTLIPFLNPSIQGWSKLWRSWVAPMDGKSAAEIEKLSKQSKGRQILSKWGVLIVKSVAVGIAVGLFNDMLYRWIDEDEDYANLPLNIKENYYLLKVGGKFIKIPKGRVIALYGSVATRISEAANGNEEALDAWSWYKSASGMVSPLESASRTIFAPFYDVATNTTWYGGQIESASMENLAQGERYDEGTSSIAIAIGKAINYSPKKIHYLIDQYSGVIGDLILPATTNKAEKDMLSSRFMVDPVYNNDISTKYYNYKDELTYAKNSGDVNAKLMLKYMNEAQDDLTEMYQKKRDIANDKSLSDKEKAAQTSAIQSLINGTLSSSIDAADEFEQLIINSGFEQAVALLEGSSEYQRMEQNVRSSAYNRMVDYYYEVCLSALTNKKLETKYVLYGALNAPDLMIYLTDINNIESDKDKKGNTIQGSRKEKVQKYIQGLKITVQQKYILSYLAGYAPTNNGKSAISKYLKNNGYTQKEVNDLWN